MHAEKSFVRPFDTVKLAAIQTAAILDDVQDYISDNPISAYAVAAGLIMILILLLVR